MLKTNWLFFMPEKIQLFKYSVVVIALGF